MKKILFFILAEIGLLSGVQAQAYWNDYTGIESEGTMPQALQDVFTKKTNTPEDSYLKALCEGGKIVYGSSLNKYLDVIMDNLLADNQQLRNRISVFVVKSPAVNAYAMNQGFIFVNVGLLAQITNEAELAFVLAHEIVHIAEQHSVMPPKTFNLNTYLRYHNRSREQENEADRYALQRYFAASKYSYKAMETAFDVLQYGYLPFDEIPFKRGAVETDFYTFDNGYFLENVNTIRSREDYIDTLSTHPNILKRRNAAQTIIASKDDQGRSAFVQSEDLFKEIQTIARLECIHQYLTRHDYGNAYYNAYVLSATMPESRYLQNAMAVAIYGLSKHRQEAGLREVLPKSNNIEGEKQRVYYFFEKLTKQEFNALAIRLLWNAHKQDPDNRYLLSMCEDAVKDLLIKNKFKLSDFSDYALGAEITEDTATTVDEANSQTDQNKYSRIKTTSTTKVKPDQKFKTINYMLVDLKQESDFIAFVGQVQNKAEDDEVLHTLQSADGFNLKNNSILLLNPSYRFVANKPSTAVKKTLAGEKRLLKNLDRSIKILDIPAQKISASSLTDFNTDQYNQYCKIMDWLEDVYSFTGNMVFYHSRAMESVASDYNCKYAMLTSTVVHRGKFFTYGKIQDLVLSVSFCPVISPAFLAAFLLPAKTSETGCAFVEINTGKVVYSRSQTMRNISSHDAFVNAFIYDCLHAVKKGGKK
ncbi:MAG: M48 family metallopeptidase [Bacteroidales bacterium]|jgi:Zn-dependent protease with chaperone function|nr:M48 family metallopeptidase [Bacteroidales bacterium]